MSSLTAIHQSTLSISEPETRFAPNFVSDPNVYKIGGIKVSQDMLHDCFLYKIRLLNRICTANRFITILDLVLQSTDFWD
jgi:hypothetical protein